MVRLLSNAVRWSGALVLLLPGCLFIGCGVQKIDDPGQTQTGALQGHLHGGQQPVVGAVVTLFAPGTTGYGGTPVAIVSTVSVAGGYFTLPRPFVCPTNSGNVYLLATGGDPGIGTDNPALSMAAMVGPCSALSADDFLEIDEATTVAAAYALAPFATVTTLGTGIGTSATNLLGLNNAYGPASNLVDRTTGLAKQSVAGLMLPTAEVNTLADILAACVNTDGALTMGTGANTTAAPCGTLFTNATPPGGVAPVDTFQAAVDIAQNPGNNSANLFGLATATAPFQPTLPSVPVPTDFALGIVYTGNGQGLPETRGIDIDASGNAWVAASGSGGAVAYDNTVTEISPYGQYLAIVDVGDPDTQPPPFDIAIAGDGTVYGTDAYFSNTESGSYLLKINPATDALSLLHPSSLLQDGALAVDNRSSTIWIADSHYLASDGASTTVSQVTFAGVDVAASPYTVPADPGELAVDGGGNVWLSGGTQYAYGEYPTTQYLVEFSPPAVAGDAYSSQTFNLNSETSLYDPAIDHSGGVWMAGEVTFGSTSANNVAKYTPANGPTAGTLQNYPLNNETVPVVLAIDGLGRVFLNSSNNGGNDGYLELPGALTVVSPTGSLISTSGIPTSNGTFLGYAANGILPNAGGNSVRIDASGNVWVTGLNQYSENYPYAVVEIIGVAAPVVTPLSVAASTNTLGQRP